MRDHYGLDKVALDRYLTTDPNDRMGQCEGCGEAVHNFDLEDGLCFNCYEKMREMAEDGQ